MLGKKMTSAIVDGQLIRRNTITSSSDTVYANSNVQTFSLIGDDILGIDTSYEDNAPKSTVSEVEDFDTVDEN